MKSIATAALGVTAAAAIACSAAACSSSGSPRNATSSAAGTSASSGPTASATESAPGGSQTGALLPNTALSRFLENVIKGHFVGACRVTAELKNDGTLAPANPANCAAASTNPQVKATFTKLRKSVTPAGATGAISAVKVKVNGVSATGTSVSVMPDQIIVNNTSLQNILSANHAAGIASFQIRKIGNRWYVVTFL